MDTPSSSEQAQQAPGLCATGCGFFASSAGLCSKCFRDAQLKQQQQQHQEAISQTQQPAAASPPSPSVAAPPVAADPVASSSPLRPDASTASPPPPAAKAPTRCAHPDCKKKVGLTGFKCKCELTFCGTHRLAEDHDCIFDHKSVQRQRLAAANPVVQAAKVQKI